MSVYFIRAGRYFKIGYTGDADRRFATLHKSGTRYTFPVGISLAVADRELYRVIDGDKSREAEVHQALGNFDVGLEWFLDEPPVRDFIDSLPAGFDRYNRDVLSKVDRLGGWCEVEYQRVQHDRSAREVARFLAGRAA